TRARYRNGLAEQGGMMHASQILSVAAVVMGVAAWLAAAAEYRGRFSFFGKWVAYTGGSPLSSSAAHSSASSREVQCAPACGDVNSRVNRQWTRTLQTCLTLRADGASVHDL